MSYKETFEHRGYEIEIIADEDAESPDSWGNDDVFLVYDHRDFNVEVKGFDPDEIFESFKDGKLLYDGYHVLPVHAYIHSGVALSLGRDRYPFNDPWDVSFKGFALVKRTKGWSWRRDKAFKIAEGLISEWNDYLSGNVWGYNVEATGDSCWGFIGDMEYPLSEAKSCIDHHIAKERKSHYEQLKTWIKNKVPMLHREPMPEVLFN